MEEIITFICYAAAGAAACILIAAAIFILWAMIAVGFPGALLLSPVVGAVIGVFCYLIKKVAQ